MNLIIEKGNLLNLIPEYPIAHCISLDCAMGMGIAKQISDRFPEMKQSLLDCIDKYNLQHPTVIKHTTKVGDKDYEIYNLVIKLNYWNKPTYMTITECLKQFATHCNDYNITKLAMPLIGCGLDKLDWNKVKEIIEKEFKDLDIEIIIRYL